MSQTVLVSGATGFLGSQIVAALTERGDTVRRLVRDTARGDTRSSDRVTDIVWDPSAEYVPHTAFAGVDTVLCLNGATLATPIWDESFRERARASRILPVRTLLREISRLPEQDRPRAFLSGSASGYYGPDNGGMPLTEQSPNGAGFLAELCEEWEFASRAARVLGVRDVQLRTGLVMHHSGGMLSSLLPLYRAGLGAQMGSGTHWMPIISLRDYVRAVLTCIDQPHLSGGVNLTGPHPVRHREWHRELSRLLDRPTLAKVPERAIRASGAFGTEFLLASQRALPEKLLNSGFEFTDPSCREALSVALTN